jgi:cytochrome c-type biogenesis protein CcmH/NrfG
MAQSLSGLAKTYLQKGDYTLALETYRQAEIMEKVSSF